MPARDRWAEIAVGSREDGDPGMLHRVRGVVFGVVWLVGCARGNSTSTDGRDAGVIPDIAIGRCDDGVRNGEETDIDCGGACPACATGLACRREEDCASLHCSRKGVCMGAVLSFSRPRQYGTDVRPTDLTLADFDWDGTIDAATANFGADTVSILYNDGHGVLGGPRNLGTGNSPWRIISSDLNGDGHPDLAVSDLGPSHDVTLYLSLGANGYSAPTLISLDTDGGPIAAGDIDGDGQVDLAVSLPHRAEVRLILHPLFKPAVRSIPMSGIEPGALYLGALGAGTMELLVAAVNTPLLLGIPDVERQAVATEQITGGQTADAIVAVDLDEDGLLDLVTSDWDDSSLAIVMQMQPGVWGPPSLYHVGARVQGVAVADFDGDGIDDLAASCVTDQAIAIFLGRGDGTFSGPLRFEGGPQPTNIHAADLDGDHLPDLAFVNNEADNSVTVLLNTTLLVH